MNATFDRASLEGSDAELLNGLFGDECGSRGGEWQFLFRAGHLLLLAPAERAALARALKWYRALRFPARLYKRILISASSSCCWEMLPTTRICSRNGFIAAFERETGRKITSVLFGNPNQKHRRAILRAVGPGGADWVVKVGFNEEARIAIDREAKALADARLVSRSVPELLKEKEIGAGRAIVIQELSGDPMVAPLAAVPEVISLLRSWTRFSVREPISALTCWDRLGAGWKGPQEKLGEVVSPILLSPALCHGDFAAWNLLLSGDGKVSAIDWEWSDRSGIPGWDLVHLFCQHFTMTKRCSADEVVQETLKALNQDLPKAFLLECGWPNVAAAFATYSCSLNPIFTGPQGSALARLCSLV